MSDSSALLPTALVGAGGVAVLYFFRQELVARPLRYLTKKCARPPYHELFVDPPPRIGAEHKIKTDCGMVVGFSEPDAPNVMQFRGIPYARAERFAKPHAVEPWTGVRDCSKFGPASMQTASEIFQRMGVEGVGAVLVDMAFGKPELIGKDPKTYTLTMGELSEACHNLNIYAPALDGNHTVIGGRARACAPKPVLVWIHGGAWMTGSNVEAAVCSGTHYAGAPHGLVVVAINYRLNAFGCLHLPDENVTNLCLHDCVAALQWVQRNIASFGGDPACVTIAGQSAGAMICSQLLSSHATAGLFHRCVCESGAAFGHSIASAEEYAIMSRALARAMFNTPELPAKSTLEAMPAVALNALQEKTVTADPPNMREGSMASIFRTVHDRGELIHEEGPRAGLATGCNKAVPLLIGWTAIEYYALGSMPFLGPPGTRAKSPSFLVPWMRGLAGSTLSGEPKDFPPRWDALALELYDVQQAALARRGKATDVKTVCLAAASACWQVIPSMLTAQEHVQAGGIAYVYEFAFHADLHVPEACHSDELYFVWDHLRHPLTRERCKPLVGDIATRPALATLSEDMQGAWAAFVRTGDPSIGHSNAARKMAFPRLEAGAEKRVMVLGRGEGAEHSALLLTEEWASFEAMYDKMRALAAAGAAAMANRGSQR